MPTTNRSEAAEPVAAADVSLLDASTVAATILVAADGRIVRANALMRQFLGWVGEQAHASLTDFMSESMARSILDADETRVVDVRLGLQDGGERAIRGDVWAEGKGAAKRIHGVFVDGEDRRVLRAVAQHSARMEALSSLTAGIAHDFNNLLTVLVGNLYLIGEEVREHPRAFEKLKAARDAGKRGTELIKLLLGFARREELAVDSIDPTKIVDNLVPLLRRAAGTRVALKTSSSTNIGAVRASAAQFESAIVNLVVNARDAIDGKGHIAIELQRATLTNEEASLRGLSGGGDYVVVGIRDTGRGIAPQALGRVFEPFFSTKGERGTGLGLSMVRWFAEQAGGAAEIHSVVGQGTTVTLLLPAAVEPERDGIDMTMPLSTLPAGTERVVVLAADDALRATIHQSLEILGYRVTVAAAVEDLLGTLTAEPVELLIVDGLGRADADVLIRARALRRDLRIIATTSAVQASERTHSGGVGLLTKPFSLADLAGTVRRTLDAAIATEGSRQS